MINLILQFLYFFFKYNRSVVYSDRGHKKNVNASKFYLKAKSKLVWLRKNNFDFARFRKKYKQEINKNNVSLDFCKSINATSLCRILIIYLFFNLKLFHHSICTIADYWLRQSGFTILSIMGIKWKFSEKNDQRKGIRGKYNIGLFIYIIYIYIYIHLILYTLIQV